MSAMTIRRNLFSRLRTSGRPTVAGQQLPDGWEILEQPSGTTGHHVIAGPGGVYNLTVTRRAGSMRVSARSVSDDPVVKECRRKASEIGRKLTASIGSPTVVHPVVVVDGAEVQVLEQPQGVTILASSLLTDYLSRQPSLLREAGIARVRSALA